jgi:ATP-dependent helicase/nuclease subunit A
MSLTWSKEQLSAIEHITSQSGSAIVSAAAGSGKTAMLVERITRMISAEEPRIPADSIVAVTFTNDAADELKSRLEAAVSRVLSDADTGNERLNDWLNQQLINLENANICTIHSFCLRLIRDYPQEAGLKPSFRICEGREKESLSEKALNHALEAVYDGEIFTPDEKNALFSLTGEAGDSKLGNAVSELYDEYMKQPEPEAWLGERIHMYENPAAFRSLIAPDDEKLLKEKAAACLALIGECIPLSYSGSMTARLETDKAFALSWYGADLPKGEKGRLEYGDSRYGSPAGDNKIAKDEIKRIRDAYIPVFKEIIVTAGLLFDFEYVVKRQERQVKALSKLFRLYADEFTKLKIEANCVDFSDAEHYCLKLLQNPQNSAITGKIRASFHEIIVDEFQDSNAVQYAIFRAVSKDGKNLFFVGDVKQSIYRFRNADPKIFSCLVKDDMFTTLTLNTSFRSSDEVIHAVNGIFSGNMPDYENTVGTGRAEGAGYDAELSIIEIEKDSEINSKRAEADYIANRIKQMVADGFEVSVKGGKRLCNFGDFAVLVSGLSTVEEDFSAAFEEAAIPYDKQKSGDYTEVPEIKTVIALLTVIDRPFEDMELLTVLMSPLYNFTAADIADVRKNAVDKPLFDNIEAHEENNGKAKMFMYNYRRFSAYARDSGACKLVRLMYDEGVFLPLVAASYNAEKTMINIRLLLHYSESLKNLTRDTLSGLVGVLGEQSAAKLEEARYSGDDESGKVKLMTIHAAKGLEFPVCFVARTNASFNMRENHSDIIFSGNIGFAMRYIIPETRTRCDTLPHAKAKQENEAAAVAEEMRKLYVACTRAKDKLILTAALKAEKEPAENSYLSRLMQSGLKINIINASDAAPALPIRGGTETSPDKNQIQEILAAISRTYPREPLTKIPRRFTATQISANLSIEFSELGEMQDEPTVFPRTPSFMGSKRLTGKKRGDAYHKIMELIDFSAGDFEEQIQAHKSRFTEEEFNAIEPEKIRAFFSSPLGRRAAASPKVHKEFMLCTELSLSELGYPPQYDELCGDGEKPFVQGIADMFFYEDGEIILVDYKTNRNTTAEKLTELYRRQLEIYARAIEEMTGVKVREKWVYSFEVGGILI